MLDGRSLSPLAIGRFDRAEMFALGADEDDPPASELGGGWPLPCDLLRGHGGKIRAVKAECESASAAVAAGEKSALAC
jgi:hypothetical protein